MASLGPGQRVHRLTSLRDANPGLATRFPNLTDNNNSVVSPRSRLYNCFAWACGVDTLRYAPNDPDLRWPDNLPEVDDDLDAMEALFASMGYQRCDSADLEPATEKIAIYTYADGELAHAARQVESGRWASKMGLQSEDIEHDSLEDVAGENAYGSPAIIMSRPRT